MRKMKARFLLVVVLTAMVLPLSVAGENKLVSYANSLQGTDSNFGLSNGNTYPTVGQPFAMHLWSAQTGRNGDGWKYTYGATTIRGFGQTHQCSPWVGDYAWFSFMPVTGSLRVGEEERQAAFSHDNETAHPDYYSVTFDNGMRAEMTSTERCGHLRFSFPKGEDAWVVVDGYKDHAGWTIDPATRTISGWVDNVTWINNRSTWRCHIYMQFDKPFEACGTWDNRSNTVREGVLSEEGDGAGVWLKFKPGTKVQVRTASSYISPEQARLTWQQEVGKDRNFDATRRRAATAWNQLFSRVLVEGASDEEMQTFYSCLFRANLFSRIFFEYKEDGTPYYYSPYDGKIHDGYMYTDNGLWDTFRSQFPLTNLLHPTQQGKYMQAILQAQQECGWLPAWSCPGESGGMLGNHAISLLADAWAKGIRTFDPAQALEAYAHEAMNKGPWGGANGRAGWKEYWQLGYVSYPESMGSTSQTQEYAYDDFCAWQLARATGNSFYEEVFGRVMFNYRNVFDTKTGFMRGRDIKGRWTEPFDPIEWGGPYCEGNAWHYNWSVFHDVQGLIDLYGSDEAFVRKLDSVWTEPNDVHVGTYGGMIHEMKEMQLAEMGQYAHGNQPIQHMPYLYLYAGQPWKTQKHVRDIMTRLYNASPQGYPGDEDQGGMSSWFVLSALGLYAVCPGTNQYVIGSPLYPKVTLTLENGNRFVIEAVNNNADNVYIQSATLNGMPLEKNWITYADIMAGGTLRLQMGPKPNTIRCTTKAAAPFSVSNVF
ncbi:MAG: GH92 family glycosyl hydrolase [Bacteroidaceae bacterium]|nr:GH92 family glycosyl hydrolase [Bacteroidaceae bacterium]